MQHFSDLFALIEGDPRAKMYFDKLPDYVRDQIGTRAGGVNSLASLQDYAQNLLRGDD